MEKLFKEKRKRRAKMGRLLSAAALVLMSLAGAGKITGKAADAVSYRTCTVNADNSLSYETKSITDYTAVDSNTTDWGTGWYVVNGNITISSRITVSGDVHCILADGCQLTAGSGITLKEGNSLTVYGSVKGTGELKATGSSATAAGIGNSEGGGGGSAGSLTVYGGTVIAAGSDVQVNDGGVGIGGGASVGGNGGNGGSVTVYGGTVTATGGNSIVSSGGAGIGGGASVRGDGGNGGSVTVYGGTVTAAGGNSKGSFGGAGIGGGASVGGNGGNGGSVIVYGGTVTATGGNSEVSPGGAGIGGGRGMNTGTATDISFQGGTIIQNGKMTHMAYTVAVTLGEHMASDSTLSQTITGTNDTVDITVQASEGYYFPADYISAISGATDGKINNLTITRKNDTTVTITGTPNANTRITLPAAAERTYTLSVTAPVFDSVTYGYARPDAKPVTVASSGNTGTAITGAAISGADADAFELNTTQGTVIAAGSTDSTTYTVQPKSGLDAGEYSAAITVTYQNGTETAAAAGDLFFKVEPAAIPETPAPAETEAPPAAPETEPLLAVTAEEEQSAREGLNQQVQAGKTYNRLRWTRVKGADGYIIYGSKCSSAEKKQKMKELKTIASGRKTSWTHKGLKKNTWYKYQIAAYKLVNGKQVEIGSSVSLHSLTQGDGRYANPVRVKVSKTKITLKKGRNTVVKAEAVLPKGKKTEHHTEEIRYVVSDPEIISVTKNGKIKGKKKGSCTVYAVAQNGVYQKIKVKVK